MARILLAQANSLHLPLQDRSGHCVVTSPPYWGHRSYGTGAAHGELGLERQPDCNGAFTGASCGDCFVCHIRQVAKEVWRVLRDDGCFFIVLGDSYFSGNAKQRMLRIGTDSDGQPYGTSDITPVNYLDGDWSSSDLCDGCREVLFLHTARSDARPVHELGACEDVPNQEHRESHCPSPENGDLTPPLLSEQSCLAMPASPHCEDRVGEHYLASQASMQPQSLPQFQEGCRHCANCDACLSVLRSSLRDVRLCARKKAGLSSLSSALGDVHELYVKPYHNIIRAKNLVGIPWRVALSLQQDGWTLRSAITWIKVAPMPESIRDRPSQATEMVFLLTKGPSYFYDDIAVRETGGTGWHGSSFTSDYDVATKPGLGQGARMEIPGRNMQNYWILGPEPTRGGHYATFPTALARRCILAGTSAAGCCPRCQTPWVRHVTRQRLLDGVTPVTGAWADSSAPRRPPVNGIGNRRYSTEVTDHGFVPGCACVPREQPVPCIVLDPFSGASTSVLVARELGRNAIGIDLSWPYLTLSRERLGLSALAVWCGVGKTQQETYTDLPLFSSCD